MNFVYWGFSEPEKLAAGGFAESLTNIDMHLQSFEAALRLIEYSEVQIMAAHERRRIANESLPTQELMNSVRLYNGWSYIAARDGAMTLYHFEKALGVATSNLKLVGALSALMDWPAIEKTKSDFKKLFPKAKAMRHAIAHVGELTQDRLSKDKNFAKVKAVNEAGAEIIQRFYFENLVGRTYTVTKDKEMLSYSLTAESFERLSSIREQFHAPLRDGAQKWEEKARQHWRGQ